MDGLQVEVVGVLNHVAKKESLKLPAELALKVVSRAIAATSFLPAFNLGALPVSLLQPVPSFEPLVLLNLHTNSESKLTGLTVTTCGSSLTCNNGVTGEGE
jgi:hypothetical protein